MSVIKSLYVRYQMFVCPLRHSALGHRRDVLSDLVAVAQRARILEVDVLPFTHHSDRRFDAAPIKGTHLRAERNNSDPAIPRVGQGVDAEGNEAGCDDAEEQLPV